MADYRAIRAVGEGVLRVLRDARRPDGITLGDDDFRLCLPRDVPSGDTTETLVLLYLYWVQVSQVRRHLAPRPLPGGRRSRPPLAIDLHYVLIPCTASAGAQQRLLGWCMRALDDVPSLPAAFLNSLTAERTIFRSDETVEIVAEPLSLQDLTNIFDPIKPNVYPAVGYLARMIALESPDSDEQYPLVEVRELRAGRLVEP